MITETKGTRFLQSIEGLLEIKESKITLVYVFQVKDPDYYWTDVEIVRMAVAYMCQFMVPFPSFILITKVTTTFRVECGGLCIYKHECDV